MEMDEYIAKVTFNYAIREAVKKYPNSFYNGLEVARQIAHDLPAADVRPVVRGRWELDSDPGEPWRYVCNICGEKTKDTVMGKPRANFCPNCGADMMEES